MSINSPLDNPAGNAGRTTALEQWNPPTNGFFKCNFDGASKDNFNHFFCYKLKLKINKITSYDHFYQFFFSKLKLKINKIYIIDIFMFQFDT